MIYNYKQVDKKTLNINGYNFTILCGEYAKHFKQAYTNSDIDNIYHAYNKPSENKVKAFYDCESVRKLLGGTDARIIGYNCNFFSYAYILDGHLVVDTYANRYLILN